MMLITILFLFSFIYKLAEKCINEYVPFQESCYLISTTTATRAEAATACKPGHLVDITSKEEHEFVVSLLDGEEDAWTSLVNQLVWPSRELLIHEPWQKIQTDGDGFLFRLDQNYTWITEYGNRRLKSICEYEST